MCISMFLVDERIISGKRQRLGLYIYIYIYIYMVFGQVVTYTRELLGRITQLELLNICAWVFETYVDVRRVCLMQRQLIV